MGEFNMNKSIEKLETKALKLRNDVLDMIYKAQTGHIGGSYSATEIMTVLFYNVMNIDSENPDWEDRDRFVLSKGHNAPILYSILCDKGFVPKDYIFTSYRKIDGCLQGHPCIKTPGVDMTTGSLGIGLSVGGGMAKAAFIKGKKYRVYVVIGDGESNEGQIWEAAATAAHYNLDNLTAFLDMNGLQNDGVTSEIKSMGSMADKWKAFGWNVLVVNGHDIGELIDAVEAAKKCKGKPTMILCKTVKGKGVSFMENVVEFHGMAPNDEQYVVAKRELSRGNLK